MSDLKTLKDFLKKCGFCKMMVNKQRCSPCKSLIKRFNLTEDDLKEQKFNYADVIVE